MRGKNVVVKQKREMVKAKCQSCGGEVMNWWEQATGQMVSQFGMGLAGQGYQKQVWDDARSTGDYIPITTAPESASGTLYITDDMVNTLGQTSVKIEEPPDEFTQLSNHKYHELLDKFSETK